MNWVLLAGGLVAGFIDSIAGGGGLITLPLFLTVLGPGVDAVATNKVVGATAALVAFMVYWSKGKIPWRLTLLYSAWVGLGSWIGSGLTPWIPRTWFPWIVLATLPVVLWTVFKKSLWMARSSAQYSALGLAISGVVIGAYDGMWGPGGGTFMLVGLVLFGGVPVLAAVGASKFVNWVSASVAWMHFGQGGFVHLVPGTWMASGVIVGAWFGASQNSKRAGLWVRPMLVAVSVLLVLRTLLM